jgi:hypothetical protein
MTKRTAHTRSSVKNGYGMPKPNGPGKAALARRSSVPHAATRANEMAMRAKHALKNVVRAPIATTISDVASSVRSLTERQRRLAARCILQQVHPVVMFAREVLKYHPAITPKSQVVRRIALGPACQDAVGDLIKAPWFRRALSPYSFIHVVLFLPRSTGLTTSLFHYHPPADAIVSVTSYNRGKRDRGRWG